MSGTKNLKHVVMSHNTMSDKALGILASGLEVNTGIEEFNFSHNNLSLPNGRKVLMALRNMHNLKSLSLNSC